MRAHQLGYQEQCKHAAMASLESLPRAAATSMALVAIAVVFLIFAAAPHGDAASVEHTFIVSMLAVVPWPFDQPLWRRQSYLLQAFLRHFCSGEKF
jgi:hypothetical protein